MPAAEQETRNGEPLQQMLALKPGVEFSLAAGAAVVPDRQDAGSARHLYFAATTMISTL